MSVQREAVLSWFRFIDFQGHLKKILTIYLEKFSHAIPASGLVWFEEFVGLKSRHENKKTFDVF